MATRSCISATSVRGDVTAVYVHWDGDSVGDEIRKIIKRDGVAEALYQLWKTGGWSSIDSNCDPATTPNGVAGYGVPQVEPIGVLPFSQMEKLDIEFDHHIADGEVMTSSIDRTY